MSWIYQNKQITSLQDLPELCFGFVYIVTHKPTDRSYIGKKVFFHNRKQKLTKKDLALLEGTKGRKPKYKVVQKESDWLNYFGSQSEIKKLTSEGKHDEFEKTILQLCFDKKSLTYFETKYQMVYGVLESPEKWFNDNILGKFFSKDLKNLQP